jgi:hypothetical protein
MKRLITEEFEFNEIFNKIFKISTKDIPQKYLNINDDNIDKEKEKSFNNWILKLRGKEHYDNKVNNNPNKN